MNWFNDLKVGTKLIGGFLIVAIIGGIIGLQGILKSSQINDLSTVMYEREVTGMQHAAEANINLMASSRAIRAAMMVFEEAERDKELQQLQNYLINTYTELEQVSKTLYSFQGQALLDNARTELDKYNAITKKVIKELLSDDLIAHRNATEVLITELQPQMAVVDRLLSDIFHRKVNNAKILNEETNEIYASIFTQLIILTIVGMLVGILIGIALTRGLTRQLGGEPSVAVKAAAAIASGDLSTPIDASRAKVGSIIYAMKQMQSSLREVVGTVRTSTTSIAAGAEQIAAGNTDLSSRTEQQAASLQETAASMEELSSTVKSNSESAKQVTQMAMSASSVAGRGGEVVGQVVQMMNDINESSRKIADIIGVIDGIAFQTNILALNAAVEAARAGEQGRGFAVVAGEVRSLAKRSADAAKEIKDLINESVARVDAGGQLVSDAGDTMADIVNQVNKVTELIKEIDRATDEQSSGISQVNLAISQLDDVTQQNSSLVEESAAAAASLNDQVQGLLRAVAVFKLDTNMVIDGYAKLRAEEPVRKTQQRAAPAVSAPAPAALRVGASSASASTAASATASASASAHKTSAGAQKPSTASAGSSASRPASSASALKRPALSSAPDSASKASARTAPKPAVEDKEDDWETF